MPVMFGLKIAEVRRDFVATRRFIALAMSRTPRRVMALMTMSSLLCIMITVAQVTAPLFVSHSLDGVDRQAPVGGNVILGFSLFIFVRIAGYALTDIRWIVLNPALYSFTYNLVARLPELAADAIGRHASDEPDAGALAKYMAIVQKAQLALMTILQQMIVVVIPSIVEFVLVVIILGRAVDEMVGALIVVGILFFFIAVFFGQAAEAEAFSKATQADNGVFQATGEFIGHSMLAAQYDCGRFFMNRVKERIDESLVRHDSFFKLKARRALAKTAAIGVLYLSSLITLCAAFSSSGGSASRIFLLLYYTDRLLAPLNQTATSLTSLRTAFVSMGICDALFTELLNGSVPETPRKVPDAFYALAPGTWIRIRGASGSGKTTLLRQFVNEKRVRDRRTNGHVGEKILYLSQNVPVVDGSVLDNIALGEGDRTLIGLLFVRYWASLLENGSCVCLSTPMEQLSGGERQVVHIIRARLRDPMILIVDEATSAMDPRVEQSILQTIKQDLPNMCLLYVSHRDGPDGLFDTTLAI